LQGEGENLKAEARKQKILEYLKSYGAITSQEAQALTEAHRNTALKDFNALIKEGQLVVAGEGKGAKYKLKEAIIFPESTLRNLFPSKDQRAVDNYLKRLKRPAVFFSKTFDQALNTKLQLPKDIKKQEQKLKKLIDQRRNELSEVEQKRRKEKLVIDLSWASSHIEGNTYSILQTETLIKYNQTAEGKGIEEAKMILNHKDAIAYLREHRNYKKLSKTKVLELHQLLIDGLNVKSGLREGLVRISNSSFVPCDKQFQIDSFLTQLIEKINKNPSSIESAILVNLLIAYLQPFWDGNKRTSRMIGNAILISRGLLPVSFSHTSKEQYVKAILYFYEKQDPNYFKYLFLKELNESYEQYLE
jgi:Fic family protein